MCKFLTELLKPKETTSCTSSNSSNTEVEVIDIVDTADTETAQTETNDNTMEEKVDRLEFEKRIADYAVELASGKVRKLIEIAVHCTATEEGVEVTIEDIDKWHKARGFNKQKQSGHYCGYHYVVALDGTIMFGRYLCETGAHVKDHNSKSIGVCYVGGLDKNGKPKDTRTDAQKETLVYLISKLKSTFNIDKVQGHRDYSPDTNGNGIVDSFEWIKSCPCFDAIPEYKNV